MPPAELSVKPTLRPVEKRPGTTAKRSGAAGTSLAGARERERRQEALRRQRADERAQTMASAGELGYLRAQLRVAANLTAQLAATHEIEEMAQLVVRELHCTFAFYLAAVQRLDGDGMLRLVASAGPLAEVMTEFLLLEQPVSAGVNGRVARSGCTALVQDTRADADYVARDPQTDPRSELSAPIFVDGAVWGVLNIEAVEPGAFGEADAVLVETIAASLGAAVHRAGLLADMERTFTTTLAALTSTVEAKDDYTACHGEDVASLAARVALRMGLSRHEARDVRYAAMLHDIGKIAVPSEILLKPGPLTDAEWLVMRSHAAVGGDLVGRIEAFAHLAPAVRASHERWDGGGYPDGLAGERIPLAARIIAACDTYDAIVTDRPYRPARTPQQAAAELRRVAGAQLDAAAVQALLAELAAAD
ncbi:MAG TPA: HD domain-containing phosphohydrolase [Solirubrobacteraceae bacterium]|jgi:HD-GYP domain-containing protein (c-di-GMP phosphodiesterase class II)|nr:HD domain-containing phosphohydrolase [Solirubrobacteraceae bacterium]